MSDMRDRLEREARRIQADPDAFERVGARAQRRHRQRRVVSGLVALTVAGTGIFVAVRTFDSTGGVVQPRPAGQPPGEGGDLPIWPSIEQGSANVAAIDAIQQQVDEGHQPWYLSPQIVGEVFAMEVLEWERRDIQASVRGDDPVQVAIANPTLAGPMGDVRTMLNLERWRGREDGIFVITRADAEILDLRTPAPGHPVPSTDKLTFSGALQGISQRLLALRLTINIEGGVSFGSYESVSPIEVTEGGEPSNPSSGDPLDGTLQTGSKEVVPGPDGEFETTVAMPFEVPPMPGVSVYVRDGTGAKIAVEGFRLGPPVPSEAPMPGPTPTSDDATPAPVQVEVADGTGELNATSYLGVLLQGRGRGTHHGGYSIVAWIDPITGDFEGIETTEVIERTVIYRVPGADDEAERLRRLVFPDAEMRGRIPGSGSGAPIRIHLGRDFLVSEEEGLAVFNFVYDFLDHRLVGARAERYLSPEALRLYESRRGGLSLYGYSSHEVGVRALHEEEGGSWQAVVALSGKSNDTHYESLELTRVSDTDMTQWTITYAERNS